MLIQKMGKKIFNISTILKHIISRKSIRVETMTNQFSVYWDVGKKIILFTMIALFYTNKIAFGLIAGSVHDFSGASWSLDGEICSPCHTPHNADTSLNSPLWDHEISNATYTLYDSDSLQEIPNQPGTYSILCLSCHDGTVALDSYGGHSGTDFISGDALIGTVLSDDHPVGIQWTHQDVHGECGQCHNMHQPNSMISILPFFDGRVECATCHEAHNTYGIVKLLRKPLTNSELCLHCHQK